MKQIVLDTNALVSGLLSPSNPPGRIVDRVQAGLLQLVIDDRILAEYRAVLRRPYFAKYLSQAEVEWTIDFLTHACDHTVSTATFTKLPEPNDACFLEVAYTAKIILVTGNLKHFPARQRKGVTVLSPREFIETSSD